MTNIASLYALGVGSVVPDGAISSSWMMVTVLASMSSCKLLRGAPNFAWKSAGSTLAARSLMDRLRDRSRRKVITKGPRMPATAHALSRRPWMAPTCMLPKRSETYAAIVAKPPPYMVNMIMVIA